MKMVLVIDGQSGRVGRMLCDAIKKVTDAAEIFAVGVNSLATAEMLKSGIIHAATGENAALVCIRKADIIVGPMGIVLADSMLGEITPEIAKAVGQSEAKKILIPMSGCRVDVIGGKDLPLSELIKMAANRVQEFCEEKF